VVSLGEKYIIGGVEEAMGILDFSTTDGDHRLDLNRHTTSIDLD